MTISTPSPEMLARGLSGAQRAAIIGWNREYADPNTIRSIRRRGLAIRTTLTPIGIAVRHILTEEQNP